MADPHKEFKLRRHSSDPGFFFGCFGAPRGLPAPKRAKREVVVEKMGPKEPPNDAKRHVVVDFRAPKSPQKDAKRHVVVDFRAPKSPKKTQNATL